MPVKELPVLITPSIASNPNKMAKAVMRNFDHLIGEAGFIQNIVAAGPDESAVTDIVNRVADGSDVFAKLNEQGVGNPDGAAPIIAPSDLQVTPGINYDLWLTWVPVKNNSPVTYLIERRVGAGAYAQIAETVVVPGQDKGHWHHHDTGLLLNTDYYYRVRASDDDGDGPYSTETGPHRVNKTVNEQIADATINLSQKVTGLLPQANLGTISDPAKLADGIISSQATFDRIVSGAVIAGTHIVGGTIVSSKLYSGSVAADRIQANNIAAGAITADKISVGSLSAINANMGNIVAGTLTSVDIYSSNLYSGTITGALIQTSSSGARVELSAGHSAYIAFYDPNGTIVGNAGGTAVSSFVVGATNGANLILISDPGIIEVRSDSRFDGAVWVGTDTSEPPNNYVLLYKQGNGLYAKAPGRAAVLVAAL